MARTIGKDLTTTPATLTVATVGVIATYASIVLASSDARSWPHAATFAGQLLLPAALGSAVVLCIAYSRHPRDPVAWMAAATTMIGVQSLPTLVSTDGRSPFAEQAPISSAIVLGLALLLLVKVAEGRNLRVAPIPVGVAIGLALILVRAVWSRLPTAELADPANTPFRLDDTFDLDAAACALLLAVGVVLALAVARQWTIPLGHRRIVVASLLWPVPQALQVAGLTSEPAWSVVAIACGLATCVLLASASVDLLWRAVHDEQTAVRHLQQQLLALHAKAREGIEQLHEVKGTIAGIASATDLIRYETRLSRQHRERLEELLATETARLQRLVHTQPPDTPPSPVNLDDVIRPLVLARRIQGHDVSWQAPEPPVIGGDDDVAETVNILLHNAAEHAVGASVRIFTRGGGAELVVADDGPGIPLDLQDAIFEWGYSRPGSNGQGVGLAVARRLLQEHGRTLRLDTNHKPGAAFVIGLIRHPVEGLQGDSSVLAG